MINEGRARNGESSADTTLRDAIRSAPAGGHPLSLLSLASMVIHVAKPEPLISLKSRRCDTDYLDRVLDGLIGARNRETTALLAVIAELLVDDPAPQLRCLRELAERDEHLPQWITALPRVEEPSTVVSSRTAKPRRPGRLWCTPDQGRVVSLPQRVRPGAIHRC